MSEREKAALEQIGDVLKALDAPGQQSAAAIVAAYAAGKAAGEAATKKDPAV